MPNTKNTLQNTFFALISFFFGALVLDLGLSPQYQSYSKLFEFIGVGAITLAVFLLVRGPKSKYNASQSNHSSHLDTFH